MKTLLVKSYALHGLLIARDLLSRYDGQPPVLAGYKPGRVRLPGRQSAMTILSLPALFAAYNRLSPGPESFPRIIGRLVFRAFRDSALKVSRILYLYTKRHYF
jgi:hypothetical protein